MSTKHTDARQAGASASRGGRTSEGARSETEPEGARIDTVSLLVDVKGDASLAAVERVLEAHGLTLDVDSALATTVDAWLAAGAPGARSPWRDPVDHVLAGFEATLGDGRALRFRPGPRRAVGPDLVALIFGTRGRFARVTRAWLRIHPRGVARPEAARFVPPAEPPVSAAEARIFDALARELAR